MPVIHEFREMFQIVFHGFGVLFDTAELLNSKFGYLRFIVFDLEQAFKGIPESFLLKPEQ